MNGSRFQKIAHIASYAVFAVVSVITTVHWIRHDELSRMQICKWCWSNFGILLFIALILPWLPTIVEEILLALKNLFKKKGK